MYMANITQKVFLMPLSFANLPERLVWSGLRCHTQQKLNPKALSELSREIGLYSIFPFYP